MKSTSIKMLAAAVVFIAGCGDDSPNGIGGPTAQLKVVHAAAALGAVEVRVGGAAVINGLSYGNSSAITTVPAGAQRLTFRSGGSDVAVVDVTLSASGINAIAFNGDTAQVTPVTPDTGQAAPTYANIRFINIAGTNASPPTLLSILVNFSGVPPDSTAVLYAGFDATVPKHGSLLYFAPGPFRFRFVPQGTTNVLAEVLFDVAAGEKKAVVLERSAGGTYAAKVVTEP